MSRRASPNDFDLSGPGRTALADEIPAGITFVDPDPLIEELEKLTGFTL